MNPRRFGKVKENGRRSVSIVWLQLKARNQERKRKTLLQPPKSERKLKGNAQASSTYFFTNHTKKKLLALELLDLVYTS